MGRLQVEKVKQQLQLTDVRAPKEIPRVGHLGDLIVKRSNHIGNEAYQSLGNYHLRSNVTGPNGYEYVAGRRLLNNTDWPHDLIIRSSRDAQLDSGDRPCQVTCQSGQVTATASWDIDRLSNDHILSRHSDDAIFQVLTDGCPKPYAGSLVNLRMNGADFQRLCSDFNAMYLAPTVTPTPSSTQSSEVSTSIEQPTEETSSSSSVLALTPSSSYEPSSSAQELSSSMVGLPESSSSYVLSSSMVEDAVLEPTSSYELSSSNELGSSTQHYAPSSSVSESLSFISELPSSTYLSIVAATTRHIETSSAAAGGVTTTLLSRPCPTITIMHPETVATTIATAGTAGTTGPIAVSTDTTGSTNPNLSNAIEVTTRALNFSAGIAVGVAATAALVLTAIGISSIVKVVKSYLARKQDNVQLQIEVTPTRTETPEYTITQV